jgi:hypothetical protein
MVVARDISCCMNTNRQALYSWSLIGPFSHITMASARLASLCPSDDDIMIGSFLSRAHVIHVVHE